ncbi:MAG: hypothetical protein NTV06_00545 [candidate division Zixibacteria bacterium]|nr:hypothetical protein [candidate division Zixibacteria bacterium]
MKQTRLKVVLIGLALGLIEGVAKAAFPSFPIVETFGFQGAIIGAYLTARTVSGIKGMSMENGNGNDNEHGKEIPSDRPEVCMTMVAQ